MAEDLLTGLVGIARDYVRSEVRVTVESNLLPPLPVYSGSAGSTGQGGGGLAGIVKLLGLRGGVVVRNAQGNVLAKFGDPTPLDPVRAGLIALGLVGLGYLLVRALR